MSLTPRELLFFFFQAEDGIRDYKVTGVQTCALPIWFLRIPKTLEKRTNTSFAQLRILVQLQILWIVPSFFAKPRKVTRFLRESKRIRIQKWLAPFLFLAAPRFPERYKESGVPHQCAVDCGSPFKKGCCFAD